MVKEQQTNIQIIYEGPSLEISSDLGSDDCGRCNLLWLSWCVYHGLRMWSSGSENFDMTPSRSTSMREDSDIFQTITRPLLHLAIRNILFGLLAW